MAIKLWTNNIPKMIEDFSGPMLPSSRLPKPPKGAKILGKVPEDLQKLISICKNMRVEAEVLMTKAEMMDPKEMGKVGDQAVDLIKRARILSDLFWWSLGEELDLSGANDMALGENWQVFEISEEDDPLSKLIKSMASTN